MVSGASRRYPDPAHRYTYWFTRTAGSAAHTYRHWP
jgi:hypothetical protein